MQKNAGTYLLLLMTLAVHLTAQATPQSTTFQARIIKPDGNYLEDANVPFRFTILAPVANCILSVEDFGVYSMAGSRGTVAISLGKGSAVFIAAPATNFSEVFNNFPSSAYNCQGGGTYMPTSDDSRRLVPQFYALGQWNTLSTLSINSVPYANYAGLAAKLTGLPNCNPSTEALTYNGTAFACLTTGGGAGTVTNVTGTLPISVSNGGTTPAISIATANTSTTGALSSTDWNTFNGKQASGNYVTTLSGDVTSSGFAAGTVTATIANNAVTTGKISNGAITAAKLSSMDATTGQIMKWNGTAWVASSDVSGVGTVTSVTAAGTANNPIVVGGTASAPSIDITRATTSANGYLTSTDWSTFNNKLSASLTSASIFVGNAGGTATGVALSGDATLSNAGMITIANNAITAAKLSSMDATNGQVMKWNGSAWVASSDISGGGGTVTSVTAAATANNPIVVGGSASAPSIDITKATASANGYLTSTDWSTFNGKLDSTSTYSGDVSGTSSTMSVDKIKGTGVTITSLAGNNYLRYDGTVWRNTNLVSTDITTGLGYTPSSSALPSGNIFVGSAGGIATGVALSGDATLSNVGMITIANNAITTAKINDAAITAAKLSSMDATTGQIMKWNGSAWVASSQDVSAATGTLPIINGGTGSTTQNFVDLTTAQTIAGAKTFSNDATFNGNIAAANGSSAAPAYSFSGGTNTGIYFTGGSILGFTVGGTNRSQLSNAGWSVYVPIRSMNGSQTAPGIAFDNDINTGFFTPSNNSDIIGITTGGVEKMRIDPAGNLGIGTTNPTAALHLKAGTTAANTAPLKLTSGDLTTAAEAGAIEYDGSNLFFTDATATRRALASASGGGSFTNVTSITGSGDLTVSAGGTNKNLILAGTGTGVVTTASPLTVTNATASTNSTTGAAVITGGLGVGGDIFAASSVNAGSSVTAATSVISPQLYGSTAASGDIKIDGTSNAAKGNVLLASAGGNVGIGTTTPSSLFQIQANSLLAQNNTTVSALTLSHNIVGAGANGIGTQIVFQTDDASDIMVNSAAILGQLPYAGTGAANTAQGALVFQTLNGATLSEKMRIDYLGNVGIGTTAPDTALDVGGAFSLRGMAAPAASPAGQGRIYFDSTANKFKVSQNNGAYTDLVASGGGTVTSISAAATANNPIVVGGTASAPSIDITRATASANGYLTSTDFTTFNDKQVAGNYVTTLSGDVTSSGFTAGTVTATIANNAITTAKINDAAITAAKLSSMDATTGQIMKWSGAAWVASSQDVSAVTGTLPIGNGGTGSTTQNFVDLTTAQTISGDKTFTGNIRASGQLSSGSQTISAGATDTINWNNGNVISTNYTCASNLIFNNLRDGGTYTLVITDTGTTQCSFATATTGTDAATVSYRFKPANAVRTATSHSVYTLMRAGAVVYVSWATGF